jgi:hypothetical protein
MTALNKALKGAKAMWAYRKLSKMEAPYIRDWMLDKLGMERQNAAAAVFGGLGLFALGLLAGSVLGVVFAPMTGSEIRATFREQGVKGVMEKARHMPLIEAPSA